jgi:hypothetical protein
MFSSGRVHTFQLLRYLVIVIFLLFSVQSFSIFSSISSTGLAHPFSFYISVTRFQKCKLFYFDLFHYLEFYWTSVPTSRCLHSLPVLLLCPLGMLLCFCSWWWLKKSKRREIIRRCNQQESTRSDSLQEGGYCGFTTYQLSLWVWLWEVKILWVWIMGVTLVTLSHVHTCSLSQNDLQECSHK